MDVKKEWLTPDEAAAEYGHTAEFWRQKAVEGAIVGRKNGHWVLQRVSIEAFMTGTTPAPGAVAPVKPPTIEAIVNQRPEVIEARAQQAVAEAENAARLARDGIKLADELTAKHNTVDTRLTEINGMAEAFNIEKIAWGKKTHAIVQKLDNDRAEIERAKQSNQADIAVKVTENKREAARLKTWEAELNEINSKQSQRAEELQKWHNSLNEAQRIEEADIEFHDSMAEKLRRNYHQLQSLLQEVADVLDRNRFAKTADEILDSLGKTYDWYHADITEHVDEMLATYKRLVDISSRKASDMANLPKQYSQRSWDAIIDNLEDCCHLLPELKPPYWPEDEELIPKQPSKIKTEVITHGGLRET